jgi:DNA helicase-2/ATP-dependent DNA helicase PcrA
VPQVLNQCKLQKNTIDFADQLWFIHAYNIPVETFDVMLADEIQDWNPLQQMVAIKALGVNGRFIGVGDKHQSIYGFSGADTNSIENMGKMLEKLTRGLLIKPLTYTRRCPKTHVALAQAIVPEFRAFDDAPEGFVAYPDLDQALTMIKRGDMGICRRNAPLISIAYKLIKSGIPVIVKGRDIGKGLIVLINKLAGKKITKVSDLLEKAEVYRSKELDKLQKKGKKAESAITNLNDKIDTLIAICEEKDTVKEAIEQIDSLFQENDKNNSIILSSVHKCKGLEAESVFVFEYDRIEIALKDVELAQQERWLHYISLTRSKNALYLVMSK